MTSEYIYNEFLKKTIGDKIVNNGYHEFLVEENWAIDQNRARRYRMGAVSVALLSGGTIEPKYDILLVFCVYFKNKF